MITLVCLDDDIASLHRCKDTLFQKRHTFLNKNLPGSTKIYWIFCGRWISCSLYSKMMRSPCRGARQKRVHSPFKIYESPSTRPSSLKRGKRSQRTLKSRNGRSLTAQFANCRKSERPTVYSCIMHNVLFIDTNIFFIVCLQAEMHMELSNMQKLLFAEQRKNIEMQQSMQGKFVCLCMHACTTHLVKI